MMLLAVLLFACASLPDVRAGFTSDESLSFGGGTAGLTVASRLTEDPKVSVLVVEAGADKSSDPLVLTPGLGTSTVSKPDYDWSFRSVPQPNLLGRVIGQPRGKQLGGSSAINLMVIMYPSQENIDAWGSLGNSGWSFDELAPYFHKMATVTPPSTNAKEVTHVDEWYDPSIENTGPLQIGWGDGYTKTLNGAWVETFDILGLNMSGDPRTGNAIGGFQNMQSVDPITKTRSYSATSHYGFEQRARKNLVVLTNTVVQKILTKKTSKGVVATGILMKNDINETHVAGAKAEVILAAGALQSPQILELSGIGSRKLLEKYQIPVVIDNPNVGEHLQDHAIVAQLFEIKDDIPNTDLLKNATFLENAMKLYATNRTGWLAQAQLASAYTPFMNGKGRVQPTEIKQLLDKHLSTTHISKEIQVLRSLMEKQNYNQVQYHLFPATLATANASGVVPTYDHRCIAAMALLSHPFSRGNVHITSSDVDTKPAYDPAFMSHPLDIELLANSVQFTENIVNTSPFSDALTGVRHPDIVADTIENAKDIIREVAISSFHPSGSCGMRPQGERGVVNARLLVHGTSNIRIVDASIFPLETSGNIQATVYAVAERAADFIKQDRKSL
ncbi:hypothetical protein TruAng_004075 [Truncatella angustata]|nr:hypothetical protein TruAng_004075 [Truncatella angustata]